MRINSDVINDLVGQSAVGIMNDWLDGLYRQYEERITGRINYYRFLHHLVNVRQPKLALELGVEFGLASAYMCLAASSFGGHVVGVDLKVNEVPSRLLSEVFGNYTFIKGDSSSDEIVTKVRGLVAEFGKLGVVFQDSSHHYVQSVREWDLYSPLLDDNAIWVCDDITMAFKEPGVDDKSMVEYFDERPGIHLKFQDILHYGNTIGVILL